jgi:rSAM/selenodomain-associated transferase 2
MTLSSSEGPRGPGDDASGISASGISAGGVSVVVPTLNEAAVLGRTLAALPEGLSEVVVADGGSTDGTPDIARAHGARVTVSAPGRGPQMNAGAVAAKGEVLLFLHADTVLPPDAAARIGAALADPTAVAGAFLLGIDSTDPRLGMIARAANLRTRITGAPYGDQALFVRRGAFEAAGGFPDVPIMEDVALGRALKRVGRVVLVPARVRTSARRWERDGVARTTLRNAVLISLYLLGVAPARLARWYRPSGGPKG